VISTGFGGRHTASAFEPVTRANSASCPRWDEKWLPAKVQWCSVTGSKGECGADMAHSRCGCVCGRQVKLCDLSLTRVILELCRISHDKALNKSISAVFYITWLHLIWRVRTVWRYMPWCWCVKCFDSVGSATGRLSTHCATHRQGFSVQGQ